MSHAFSIIITIPLDTGGDCHHPSFVESYFYLVPDTLRGQIHINVRVQWTPNTKLQCPSKVDKVAKCLFVVPDTQFFLVFHCVHFVDVDGLFGAVE